jgi:hypothetical protein
MREKGYLLLNLGYFVCGFQVVFIGVHFPTYLLDKGLGPEVGMTCAGADRPVQRVRQLRRRPPRQPAPKRHLLAGDLLRAQRGHRLFLWLPLTPASAYVFAATMGLLWLSTVPLTNAIVAQVFGVRFLGMLSGLVFFSHQVGSFLGVWLGGKLFDATGSYNTIWGICILLGVVAALMPPADRRAQPGSAAPGHGRLNRRRPSSADLTGFPGPDSLCPAARFPGGRKRKRPMNPHPACRKRAGADG